MMLGMMQIYLQIMALISLSAASGLFLSHLFIHNTKIAHTGTYCTLFAIVMQTLAIGLDSFQDGFLIITTNSDTIGYIAWSFLLLFAFLIWKYRLYMMGAFVLPIVMVCLGGQLAFSSHSEKTLSLHSTWIIFHLVFSIIADATMLMAGVFSAVYLLQDKLLKEKKVATIWKRFPPLPMIDNIFANFLLIGFICMTLSMTTGTYLAAHYWGDDWYIDPRQVWSFLMWLSTATLLFLRLALGFRGKKIATVVAITVVCILLGFILIPALRISKHDSNHMHTYIGAKR